jgi:predicted Rdx family selenoprotein
MRVRQANNLSRIAWISENFLVTGEAGIENDFAAPARNGAGSAAVKDAPVFERQRGRAMRNFGQCCLLKLA